MYSRVEIAVVNGAAGIWISSLAEIVNVVPSGAFVVAGGVEATFPSSTGGAASIGAPASAAATVAIGSGVAGSGSAEAGAAVAINAARTTSTEPPRTMSSNAFRLRQPC